MNVKMNPGLSPRYWAIDWGQSRGPYKKEPIDAACKSAFGGVYPGMLAVDLGNSIAPVRTAKFAKVMSKARDLKERGLAGIYQADWSTLELVKIAAWKDEPFISVFKNKLDRAAAFRDPQKLAFEDKLPAAAEIEDDEKARQAVKALWRKMFLTDPDSDARFVRYVEDAGYEWA